MKGFWLTVCVFLALIGIVIWNYYYINRTADTLRDYITELSDSQSMEEQTTALETYWEEKRPFVSLSVSYHHIEKMDQCVAELKAAARTADKADFWRAYLTGLDAVEDIRRLEKFSLENIF